MQQQHDEHWAVAAAKTHFSEVLEKAAKDGPQTITRHGRRVAVIVSAEEWDRKTARSGSLAEFFAASPLRGAEIEIARVQDDPREIGL